MSFDVHMISGELVNPLTGRYVKIWMLPLPFREITEAIGMLKEQSLEIFGFDRVLYRRYFTGWN